MNERREVRVAACRQWGMALTGIAVIAGLLCGCKGGGGGDAAAAPVNTAAAAQGSANLPPQVKDMLQRQNAAMQQTSSGYSAYLKQHPNQKTQTIRK